MWLLFKTKLLIYQPKDSLVQKILFGKITHLLDLEIRKILVRGWEREFHGPFWSMMYLSLKFTFNTMASFRNRILISIAIKSWTRMEHGIIVSIEIPYKHFSNFLVSKMSDVPNKTFTSKLALD